MLFTRALHRERHRHRKSLKVHSQSFQKLIYLYFFQIKETMKREERKRLPRAQVRNRVEIDLF